MTHSNQETQYNNNSTSSACYINEVKRIQPKRGDEFIALKVSLLDGKKDDPSYQNADLTLKGTQARHVIEMFEDKWPNYSQQDRPTIFANIRFGSIGVKPYLKKNGEPDAVLSGRLIKVKFLSIDKQVIFQENHAQTEQQPAVSTNNPPVSGEYIPAEKVPHTVHTNNVGETIREQPAAAVA